MPTQPQSVDDDVNQTTCYFRQGGQITDNIDITYLRNRKKVWGLTAEARIIDRTEDIMIIYTSCNKSYKIEYKVRVMVIFVTL